MNVSELRERRFRVGADRREYAVRFSQNALMRLDEATQHRPLTDLLNPGVVNTQWLLWGGLEGARLASKRPAARSHDIFDVGNLLETIYEQHGSMVYDLDFCKEIRIGDLLSECFLAASRQVYHVAPPEPDAEPEPEPDPQDPTDGESGSAPLCGPESGTTSSGT